MWLSISALFHESGSKKKVFPNLIRDDWDSPKSETEISREDEKFSQFFDASHLYFFNDLCFNSYLDNRDESIWQK